MSVELSFIKAVRLLDAGRHQEAVDLLNKILDVSRQNNDVIHIVRSSCVLGEYFLNTGNVPAAKQHLEIAVTAETDDDQAAILKYEINLAKKLLLSL